MTERIVISKDNQKHIQAYIDYKNIVGVDDGGKVMSEKEFEAYKKKVAEARKNHLYVYWVNPKNFDCKAIGPESMCFCGHRYKYHNFDNVKTKKVNCKQSKCKCPLFDYVPVYGSNDCKCLCKHSYSLHDPVTKKCGKTGCKCTQFGSKFTCNCTYTYDDHVTAIETREERLAQGKQVDPGWMSNNMTAGIGGLNSFSSMVNDVYQLEFNALLNDPDQKLALMAGFEGNKMIGSGTSGTQIAKKTTKSSTVTALELFKTPLNFGGNKAIGNTSHNLSSNNDLLSKVNSRFNKMSLNK